MKPSYIIIIIGIMLFLTSCGKQYDAEQTVKDFVENNMNNAKNVSSQDFGDLGSTRHISDSLIAVMRKRGAIHYRQGISYGEIPAGDLYYLRMKYVYEGDSLQNTFYLDSTLNQVVAFK